MSETQPSGNAHPSLLAIGAATLACLGVSTLIYSKRQSVVQERKAKQALQNKLLKRQQNTDNLSSLINNLPRKVTLYFDKNDDLVYEEVVLNDTHNYPNKYHSLTVDFGSEDSSEGTDLLTKDIFCGSQKTENAQIFLDNYAKSKAKH